MCFLTMAIRKIVQFNARRTSGDFEQDMMGGNRQWIPLKLLELCHYLLKLSCLYLLLWLVYLSQIHRNPLLALLVICSVLV
jgi:hypothetical protein